MWIHINLRQLGVTRTVRRRIEVPKEVLDRLLLEEEKVIGEYDYYYNKKRLHATDVRFHIFLPTASLIFIFT